MGEILWQVNNKDSFYNFPGYAPGPAGGVILKDGTNAEGNGYFSALDVATGHILWENKAPFAAGHNDLITGPSPPEVTAMMSVANGVVYGFINDDDGTLVAMDAATGQVLLQFPTANSAAGHPSTMRSQRAVVVNGVVYFGTGGAQHQTLGLQGNKFFALELPSR